MKKANGHRRNGRVCVYVCDLPSIQNKLHHLLASSESALYVFLHSPSVAQEESITSGGVGMATQGSHSKRHESSLFFEAVQRSRGGRGGKKRMEEENGLMRARLKRRNNRGETKQTHTKRFCLTVCFISPPLHQSIRTL